MLNVRFPLWLKMTVYKGYARSAILYGREAWWLKESEMLIYKGQKDLW